MRFFAMRYLKTFFAFALVFAFFATAGAYEHGPGYGHRPGERPHDTRCDRRGPGPHFGFGVDGVWIEMKNEPAPPPSDPRVDADGVVTIAPPSPSEWTASRDIASGTFEMSAPISLPYSIAPQDVASIRAIFNEKADASSISTTIVGDMERVYIIGRAASFAPLGKVELVQIVLERVDGRILAQDLSVGLRSALGDDDVF